MKHTSAVTLIRETVTEQGRSFDWLARQLGVSPSYVYKMLGGARPLTGRWFERACAVLGIPRNIVQRFEQENAA